MPKRQTPAPAPAAQENKVRMVSRKDFDALKERVDALEAKERVNPLHSH